MSRARRRAATAASIWPAVAAGTSTSQSRSSSVSIVHGAARIRAADDARARPVQQARARQPLQLGRRRVPHAELTPINGRACVRSRAADPRQHAARARA
jgi:hypothetical protein